MLCSLPEEGIGIAAVLCAGELLTSSIGVFGDGVLADGVFGDGVSSGELVLHNSLSVIGRRILEGIHPSLPSISTYQVSV